jgi:hypothetical protein
LQAGTQITSDADIKMFGVPVFENVDVFHVCDLPAFSAYFVRKLDKVRLRSASSGVTTSLRRGLPSRSWRSQKAGGARRDRTADLLHAMQALSQLSYGPVHLARDGLDQIATTL